MLRMREVTRAYAREGETVRALDGVSLTIDEGEFLVIQGASGSGKSTLLLALGGMLRPTAGDVLHRGTSVYSQSSAWRNRYRRSTVGFVFQRFFLIPYLTVLDNIRMPLCVRHSPRGATAKATALAEGLQISKRLGHRPSELSVGEQQRVAMARALVGDPGIILADEPTGNLDAVNAKILAERLGEENRRGRTVVLVTHDPALMDIGSRKLRLTSGKIEDLP